MIETENPAIKLFGKRIRVPVLPAGVSPSTPAADSVLKEAEAGDGEEETEQDPCQGQSFPNNRIDEDEPSMIEEELISPKVSSDSANPQTPSIDEETSKPKDQPENKALKKPDKILPCPRCNSLETKFCYYNNYNLNQPRHFCKSCQRYWTAGGTMRAMAVGAGRRKSKSSTSRCCHVSISEALKAVGQFDSINGAHHNPNLTPNGTVLTFGPNHNVPEPSPVKKRATGALSSPQSYEMLSNPNGLAPQYVLPYGKHFPFYPPPFCGCTNVCLPQGWTFPTLCPPNLTSGRNSPVLGKHQREGDTVKGSVLIPKTLRIDDPIEAAKSSIWATLGIKNECGAKGGVFRGFQPKAKENEKETTVEAEAEEDRRVLCANPAALARSHNFHERT